MTTFDAVLSDLDGVIRQFDHEEQEAIEARYGLPLMKTALRPDLILPPTVGKMSEREWLAAVAAELGGTEDALRAVEEFREQRFWVDEEVRKLLAKAQERVPLIIVTNAMDTLDEHLDRIGLTYFADAVVSSAKVGVAKPDPRIYILAAELAGVAPERCLFIDDRLENVEAARRLGMTGVHFRSAEDLVPILA
ncbi:HAD-IA family hydrolase [Nonomuraea longicatena]|uniref:HAD family phosphatase n=1 Tax=Nonomuraea longicatena TaxID=83682 RepID=A0ABN1NMC3_9ACTN